MEEVEISSINYVSIKWTKFKPETIFTAQSADMTLATVDSNRIKVHQEFMSSISPFFANILKEIESPQYPIIVLTDIEFPEIQAICEFLYNGEVLVPADRVVSLMRAADKLQIKGLAREEDDEVEHSELRTSEDVGIENAIHDVETLESGSNLSNSLNVLVEGSVPEEPTQESSESPRPPEKKVIIRRRIRKVRKEKKSPFPTYPLKTATVATIASRDIAEDGTTTATLTTQVVPIVSTILIDTPIPIRCDVCGVSCENERILSAHMKIHQGKYIVYVPKDETKKAVKHLIKSCPHCPYASEHVTSLAQHIRTHTGEKPYRCEVCDKAFPRKTSLTDHMRCHTGERPYSCDQCEKRFTQRHILQNHVATIHSNGERPITCDYCDKSFTIKKALQKHMETHKLKSIRKRITSDGGVGTEQVEEIIEEIEEADENGDQKVVQVVYRKGQRHRKRRKKLINELTASDYSDDESDPEFKCNVKLDSIISTTTEATPDDETNAKNANEGQQSGIEAEKDQSSPRPTRILPKRNAGKPRKSLSPSPTRKETPRRKSQPTASSKPNSKAKKPMNSSIRISDPINASDYYYYKRSYNVNPPNLPNIYAPPVNQEPEFIIEL